MTEPGEWTLESARTALPEVRRRLAVARTHVEAMQAAGEQLQDLRIVHGEQVMAVASPGYREFKQYWDRYHEARRALEAELLGFHQMGVEVKDVAQGLVDFRGLVGDVPASLCWKDGEDDIVWWHPLEGGFAARRPLPQP